MFSGVLSALLVPFKGNAVDMAAFARLVEWQIKEGINGLVINGTTGEAPTLSDSEQDALLEQALKVAGGRIPIIAGTGGNDTAHVIARTKAAAQLGAQAVLVVTPYYNKPTQEGLYQHFLAVHEATTLPIIIYNIPGRSVVDMSVETMARLAQLPRIIGVKDATADLVRPLRTRVEIRPDFLQLSGEDATVTAFYAQGGHGVISVTSNVAPKLCVQLHQAWLKADMAELARIRDLLMPLHAALFCETSPAPVKYAAHLLGFGDGSVRLPLVPASAAARSRVEAALKSCALWDGKLKAVS
jgi:4-hydroxy-tetrahydrodipicolinate synthase